MPLIKCSECGHTVSTEAPACPQCGSPPWQQPSGGFVFPIVGLIIIAAVAWYFLTAAPSIPAIVFPVGSYKFSHASYITLSSDHTFEVKSNEDPLWRCKGTWSFDGKTLNIHPVADKSRLGWMPWMFSHPATLISNGKETVLWDCVDPLEWKKIEN